VAWAPLLLAVLTHSSGSLVQAALTQPSSLSANVGDTVRMTCSGLSSSYAYAGWYQQKVPGSGPVTVIYANDKRPTGIPSRFSGSLSGTTNTLTISGVQAEDEAVYFCGGWDSSSFAGQRPWHSPTSVSTWNWWDCTVAWVLLLLTVLTHSSGAMARLAVPELGPWAQQPRPAVQAGLCSWDTD
uniref:Ig-like domain-containing protein n=1 Tax=Cyanoderma ruficeps TaxID=181631 RepID=A0A8C3NT48_9PASS